MDLSDDLPPPRRPLFFPVVIATIFLTIIGMSAGLVLGSRHDRENGSLSSGQVVTRGPEQGNGGVIVTTTPATPTRTPATTRTPTTTPATRPSGQGLCRPETQKAAEELGAVGQLRVVLYVRTKSSAVWICLADDGEMYYHANNKGPDGPWIEGETALFLPHVVRGEDDYHVTAANGTTFSVNKVRLFIRHADGTPEEQPAVKG